MENSSSDLRKTKSILNLWNDTRMSPPNVTSTVDKAHNFARLKLFELNAMPIRSYNHEPVDIASENYYNAADKAPFNYATANNSIMPYSINTVHLQNPYGPSQRLEGYAPHNQSKVELICKNKKRNSDETMSVKCNCDNICIYNININ